MKELSESLKELVSGQSTMWSLENFIFVLLSLCLLDVDKKAYM